jgi:hypothetical protein
MLNVTMMSGVMLIVSMLSEAGLFCHYAHCPYSQCHGTSQTKQSSLLQKKRLYKISSLHSSEQASDFS